MLNMNNQEHKNQNEEVQKEVKENPAQEEVSQPNDSSNPTSESAPTLNAQDANNINLANENIQIKSSLDDLKNFVQNPKSQNQKIKTVNQLMHNEFVKIETAINNINNYIENLTHRLELTNENFKTKVQEVESKAQQKINDRIEELDKRKKEEIENAKKYAIEKSIDSAINIVDQLEIALEFASLDPAVKNYVSGFKMVLNSFVNWLASVNIHRMDIKPGDKFDEKYMSASDKASDPNYPADHVCKVMKSGYKLYDRVVRHAMVVVSDGVGYVEPASNEQEQPQAKPTQTPPAQETASAPAKTKPTAPPTNNLNANKPPVVSNPPHQKPVQPPQSNTPGPKQPITHQVIKKS